MGAADLNLPEEVDFEERVTLSLRLGAPCTPAAVGC